MTCFWGAQWACGFGGICGYWVCMCGHVGVRWPTLGVVVNAWRVNLAQCGCGVLWLLWGLRVTVTSGKVPDFLGQDYAHAILADDLPLCFWGLFVGMWRDVAVHDLRRIPWEHVCDLCGFEACSEHVA